jgi:hypothetical protein
MAGERAGRIYEALVASGLIRSPLTRMGSIHWNPESPSLMVRPDLVIGNPERPSTIVLITRAGSRRDWHKKFWRNVGEVIDVRIVFPSAALVSVNLGTEPKEELITALSAVVDVVVFPPRSEREHLERWADSIEPGAPKDADELLEHVSAALKKADSEVKRVVSVIAQSIAKAKPPKQNWSAVAASQAKRKERSRIAREGWSKPPSIRRGLAKLLVFGSPSTVVSQLGPRGALSEPLGRAMEEFGWASKSIAGWRASDPELSEVLGHFSKDVLQSVLETCTTPELMAMCADVASTQWLKETASFLKTRRADLSDAELLQALLSDSRANVSALGIRCAPPKGLVGSWLFRSLSAFLKAASGRKQGFGYEQLIGDIRTISSRPKDLVGVINCGATREDIRRAGSTDSLRRKLVDWVSGLAGDVSLLDWQIALVALVLARRVAGLDASAFNRGCESFVPMMRRLTYEDRVAPYAYFEPLPQMIESVLRQSGMTPNLVPRHATLFSDLPESDREVATCPVLALGGVRIYWKSSHGSHTGDKTKELCGRGFALRYRRSISGAVTPFRDVTFSVLVLDGDFSGAEVEHLVRAGWDEVVSSRDMAKLPALVSAVVQSVSR